MIKRCVRAITAPDHTRKSPRADAVPKAFLSPVCALLACVASDVLPQELVADKTVSKKSRESLLETLRKGPTQLVKLKHPSVIAIMTPLDESR